MPAHGASMFNNRFPYICRFRFNQPVCHGAVLLGLGYTFGGMVVISSLLTNWFISKKAFAVSVCSAGSGLAPVIMAPVLTRLIEASGLKATFLFVAGSTVIAAVILWITVKNVPEEIGLSPYLTSADEKKGIR